MATVVERGCTVAGRIEAEGHVEVHGRVEGSIRARTARVIPEAIVVGDIVARERIDVAAGARVIGDLRAPVVEIEAGAAVEGRVDLVDRDDAATQPIPRSERQTVRFVSQPVKRPTRPPQPPVRPLPALPRHPARVRLVTRKKDKGEDER